LQNVLFNFPHFFSSQSCLILNTYFRYSKNNVVGNVGIRELLLISSEFAHFFGWQQGYLTGPGLSAAIPSFLLFNQFGDPGST